MKKQTVELWSGTGSFSKVARSRGYKVFTVDNDPELDPSLCMDMFEVQRDMLPESVWCLWASPPCTTFSVASLPHYWVDKKPKNLKAWVGIAALLKTLHLIEEINPVWWFIENPVGMMRNQIYLNGLHRKTVTYCKYGDNRRKPTDIWTNAVGWCPKERCCPGSSCHESSGRSVQGVGTQGLKSAKERGEVPGQLINEILDFCSKSKGCQVQESLIF